MRRIKSKMGGHLEFFDKIKLEFYKSESRDMYLINGAEQETVNKNFIQDLDLIDSGFNLLKTLNNFTEENYPLPKIFNLLDETFALLNQDTSPELLIIAFESKLITILGYLHPLENCIQCKAKLSPETHFYQPDQLGIICQNCHTKSSLSKTITFPQIKILNFLQKGSLTDIIKLKIEPNDLSMTKQIVTNFKEQI